MIGSQFSDQDNNEDDRLYHVGIDDSLDALHALATTSIKVTGLVIPATDQTGRHVGQVALNRRLDSAQLLLGHTLDNPQVLSIPGQSSRLAHHGYTSVIQVWIVFALVSCDAGQWLRLKSSGKQLSRLWGVGVGLVGPYGFQEA